MLSRSSALPSLTAFSQACVVATAAKLEWNTVLNTRCISSALALPAPRNARPTGQGPARGLICATRCVTHQARLKLSAIKLTSQLIHSRRSRVT